MRQSLHTCSIVFALMHASISARAEDVGPGDLVEFTASTRARASEVNANFDRLAEVVNSKQDETAAASRANEVNQSISTLETRVAAAEEGLPEIRALGFGLDQISRNYLNVDGSRALTIGTSSVFIEDGLGFQSGGFSGRLFLTGGVNGVDQSSVLLNTGNAAGGEVRVSNLTTSASAILKIERTGSAGLELRDSNGEVITRLTSLNSTPSAGFISAADGQSSAAANLFVQPGNSQGGQLQLRDSVGRRRVTAISNPSTVGGSFASGAAAFVLGGSGGGLVAIGPKSFVHPNRNDPTTQIVFVALEGPEVGTYFRGTTALRSGAAEIPIPESWQLVTEEAGITIQVTPRGDCLGLYADVVSRDLIVVRELGGGTSDVVFDYTVNGVRDGFAQHAVIQPNTMFLPENSIQPEELESGIGPALIESGIVSKSGEVNKKLVEQLKTYKQRPDFSSIPYIDPDPDPDQDQGRYERSAE
jgi:hypothetical protein